MTTKQRHVTESMEGRPERGLVVALALVVAVLWIGTAVAVLAGYQFEPWFIAVALGIVGLNAAGDACGKLADALYPRSRVRISSRRRSHRRRRLSGEQCGR